MSRSATELCSPVSRATGRFAAQVSGKRVLVGYSGGVDSHVLLYELARVALIHRIRIILERTSFIIGCMMESYPLIYLRLLSQ